MFFFASKVPTPAQVGTSSKAGFRITAASRANGTRLATCLLESRKPAPVTFFAFSYDGP
mgnify:CR=1 FL=1